MELFEGFRINGDYLFFTIFPYLVSFDSCGFNVQTYVRHNAFGTLKSINHSNPCYRMIFVGCSDRCEPTYYTKAKLKKRCNIFITFLIIKFLTDF